MTFFLWKIYIYAEGLLGDPSVLLSRLTCPALYSRHWTNSTLFYTSGLWGILMEVFWRVALLFCVFQTPDKSKTALRPQRGTSRNGPRLPSLPFRFCPSLTPILLLSSSISVTFSFINHTPVAIHPSIPLPLSGEEKQTAVRVRLADEFQMTLKSRKPGQLSLEESLLTDTCAMRLNMGT